MSIPTIIQPCSAWSTSRSCTESFQTWLVCTLCHYSLCKCAQRNWVSYQYLQSSGLLVSPLIFAPQQLRTTVVIWCTRSFCSTSSEIPAICPYCPISIHSSTLHLNTVAHGKYKFWWLWREICYNPQFSFLHVYYSFHPKSVGPLNIQIHPYSWSLGRISRTTNVKATQWNTTIIKHGLIGGSWCMSNYLSSNK